LIALGACTASLLVGLIARSAAAPLGPVQSKWLSAVTLASERALIPEPHAAIVATLGALKQAFTSARAMPQLWRIDPPAVLSVDVAGYLSEQSVEIPELLSALAAAEPEHTLRVETLRALQVRRPEVRPLLAWLEARDVFCATTIIDEDGPVGFLLMPRGGRSTFLTLEEARLLRMLCARVSALLAVTSSLARARQRELEAVARATHWQREHERARGVLDGQRTRNRGFTHNLARPLLSTCYSAAARLALARIQALAASGEPLVLEVPPGSPALPWAAVAHLSYRNGDGPFVFVDGGTLATSPPELFLNRETSPLSLAAGGTLFVQDLHLVPTEFQLALLDHVTRRPATVNEASGALPDLHLVASVRQPLTALFLQGNIQRPFEPLLANRRIALPTLAERADDLRALVLDILSRTAAGPANQPLGIERAALQRLLDHTWPGNELELHDTLTRASQLESAALLRSTTLSLAGFQDTPVFPAGERSQPVDGPPLLSEAAPSVIPQAAPAPLPTPPPGPRRRPRAPRGRRRN
jgi:transcriptional regulator with AAA-type ATPase domain